MCEHVFYLNRFGAWTHFVVKTRAWELEHGSLAHFAARILSLASVLSSMNRACLGLYSDFILLAEEKKTEENCSEDY